MHLMFVVVNCMHNNADNNNNNIINDVIILTTFMVLLLLLGLCSLYSLVETLRQLYNNIQSF